MDLELEAETALLWAVCDDTCNGRSATLDAVQGRFAVTHTYERPSGMGNLNNEGFALAPQRECVAGLKPAFRSDDNNTDTHALRSGTRSCTVLDQDADGIDDAVDVQSLDAANQTFSDGTTSGAVLARTGQPIAVSDAAAPAGVQVTSTGPVTIQLDGSIATIALGQGTSTLTRSGGSSTVAVEDGAAALVTLSVRGTPIRVVVNAGGSVTTTETASGLTLTQTGDVTVSGDDLAPDACRGIAVQNIVVGTTGNDTLQGTTGNDLVIAKAGNDVVLGNGGNDCIDAGSGNNTVTTLTGDDRIAARSGNNAIDAGAGSNTVTTGAGSDRVITGSGNDVVDTGAGNDSISTGAGDDRVTPGAGNDALDCGAGTDTAAAGTGNNSNAGGRCETFAA